MYKALNFLKKREEKKKRIGKLGSNSENNQDQTRCHEAESDH